MSEKSIGGICAIISMVSAVIFFVWGMIDSYSHSWIIFMIGGVACASVSIINNIKKEKDKNKKEVEEKDDEKDK